MAEFRRPLHRRIEAVLSRMDAAFLDKADCYFGGGTQLSMSNGEFRESRDIDFLVSNPAGLRMIRETVNDRSLGSLFREQIFLEREVRTERDSIRTFIREDESAEAIKLEIILEGRISLSGALDDTLGVPILEPRCAVAEKLLANADRGRGKEHRSRDLIDLAFVSLIFDDETLSAGCEMAKIPYGESITRELTECLKMFELDAKYRAQCISDLAIEDTKTLKRGLARLNLLKRTMREPARKKRAS